ncbi:MAG: hypothetical protein ACREV7_21630 [Steroidobacteraceae bacterium]
MIRATEFQSIVAHDTHTLRAATLVMVSLTGHRPAGKEHGHASTKPPFPTFARDDREM